MSESASEAYTGTVASFGSQKGYGFINCDQVSGDVFFGRKVLPAELQMEFNGFALRGKTVGFEIGPAKDDGKVTASKVWLQVMDGEQLVGTVKSYNPVKGFGFLGTASMDSQDFFFSAREVPPAMKQADLKGLVVAFTVATAEGKLQGRELKFRDTGFVGMQQPIQIPATIHGIQRIDRSQPQTRPNAGYRVPPPPMAYSMPSPMQNPYMMQNPYAPPPPPNGSLEGQGMQGIVHSFNADKGFGFIKTGNHGDIYFKDLSAQFSVGMTVAFHVKVMPDGKLQARDLSGGLEQGETYMGQVASYNAGKGWGFIEIPGVPAQVYFKKLTVADAMGEQALQGMECSVTVNLTQDGKTQASAVHITGPGSGDGGLSLSAAARPSGRPAAPRPPTAPRVTSGVKRTMNGQHAGPYSAPQAPKVMRIAAPAAGGQRCIGTVISYNPMKGFGFLQSDSSAGDVFIGKSSLGNAGLDPAAEYKGRRFSFNLVTTPDGKPQAQNLQLA